MLGRLQTDIINGPLDEQVESTRRLLSIVLVRGSGVAGFFFRRNGLYLRVRQSAGTYCRSSKDANDNTSCRDTHRHRFTSQRSCWHHHHRLGGCTKTLKVLLYFDQWFSWCFLALAICTYAYKAWRYYYPDGALELEISLMFLYGAVETMRLFLASKGNKAEQINPLIMSLGLAVPVTFLYAFSLALQTYVLRLDVIVAAIGLIFLGLEGLLSVGTAVSFYRAFRG